MVTSVIYSLAFVLFMSNINYTCSQDEMRVLSRHKRYVVFPEGSSLTLAFCMTVNLIDMPNNIFSEVVNIGINYELPNKTGYEFANFAQPKQFIQRRYRRDLYNKAEVILDALGLKGRSCIYRALCETARDLLDTSENLVEEIIKRIFRYPLENLQNSEPEDHRLFHWAYRMGYENQECVKLFPDCSLSLINTLLGYNRAKYG